MINEIDPRIYNFKNLKLEDQVVVASQFKIFLLVKKEKEDLKETADKQNSLTKFLYEVAIEELDEVEEKIGHPVGGVCPFGVNDGVSIYLDESLKRFTTVFPACGEPNNAIELTISELENITEYVKWVDVCKLKE